MARIEITLSSANMGNVDEIDFDLWTRFVTDKIDEAMGFEIASVDQQRFNDPGDDEVTFRGPWRADDTGNELEAKRDAIRSWLSHEGWDAFCGEEWDRMRTEHDQRAA